MNIKTTLAWLLVPHRGTRLVTNIPVSRQIEIGSIKINLFRFKSKWYASEDTTGLKVGGYMPTRKSLEAEIYKRFRKVDAKKLEQNIAENTSTKFAIQIGSVIPFETIK